TEPTIIGNRNPGPGELSEYREMNLSTQHKIAPNLIILSPETPNGNRSLFLLGTNPIVFASILLSADGLKFVEEEQRRAVFPDSWEMLLQIESNDETVLRFQSLGIRRINRSSWERFYPGFLRPSVGNSGRSNSLILGRSQGN